MNVEQLAEQARLKSKSALLALIVLILSPLAIVHAATPPADSVHFCAPLDYEQWRRDNPRPAGKPLADLNVGEPRTVRMIYFSPSDHPHRAAVVDSMKTMIRQIQTFYAEQMKAHGYGNKTFRIETDAQGEPLVHRVSGPHYYGVWETFDRDTNVYLVFADVEDTAAGRGGRWTKNGGEGIVFDYLDFDTAAHELGHAFGLHHDFRDDAYIMSYGPRRDRRLSACNAEFLAVHTYFNPNSSVEPGLSPTIELISPSTYPTGSTSVPIKLKSASSKGLHQTILSAPLRNYALQTCRSLVSKKEAVVEHEYDVTVPYSPRYSSSLSYLGTHQLVVDVVDTDGNLASRDVGLAERSPYMIARLRYNRGRWVSGLSFSPDGSLLALASSGNWITEGRDSEVALWDVASRQRVASLQHERRVNALSFSPDGILLAGMVQGQILLWDVASRQRVATLQHDGWVNALSFSPDGSLLASGNGNTVWLWDVASRQRVATLQHEDWVSALSFSPDGSLLASIENENTVWLWDVASRQRVATLQHEGWVSALSFSPDGSLLASIENRNTVWLWDVASRQRVASLQHERRVNALSFSPDGSLLAVGSKWGVGVLLWDVASRQRVATLYEPHVSSISFSPDGSPLAAVSESDGAVWLWDMSKVAAAQTVHSLAKVSGDSQAGAARVQLAAPFVVSALNQDGSPVAGVRVTFSVTAGGGLLSPTSDADPCAVGSSASSIASYTDANGQASVRLTLGSEPRTNIVEATVEGLESATFTATAEQAIPQRLTKVCGDSQEGLVDEQLAESFVVSVSDEDGAAMSGVVVSFTVTAGEGALSATTTATDANGRAATKLTLGSESGTNTVEATVEGLSPVTFTATGEKSALASLFDTFLGAGKRASRPDRTQLLQNAPNPFNSQTVLSYFLLEPGSARLEVFSLTGQRVAVLHQGPQQAGYHRLHWDGRDAAGHPVASGAYLYRLVTDEAVLTRKLILLR